MDTGSTGWWRRHGWTIALLLIAFGVAFAVRTIWAYPIIERWGALYTYAGGSDSFYHSRVMTYIIQTGHNLVYDPMLKFPVGATNPREPLFDWMNAVFGLLAAPLFGGNAIAAGAWFLDFQGPFWAALEIFPIYLIGREVSGRRTGLIAALVFPFLSAGIDSSTFGYANYLSFYTFVLLVVIYSFLRTAKALGHRRYVESYRHPRQYLPALRTFFGTERTAVKWAVFTGVALGALALSWQGYTYAIVVIGIGLLVTMLIERIRRVDSFGIYVSTWIVGLVAFPMLAPYYLVQHEVKIFLYVPLLLYFGILALLLPFLMMRDVPWVFSIPALVAVVGGGVLALRFASPGLFASIATGQGYFVKTLIYTTVAEAQAPSIDQLIVGYGVVTFFLAFVGLALVVYLLVHHRFKRHHIFLLVYLVVSIYLPISATKFFLVGAPAFALLSGEAIRRALDVGSYSELRRNVASLSDSRSKLAAFRRAFKARHVLILALVVGLLLPNVWVAIDAGIPGNAKHSAALQINATIPAWLKLNSTAPASNYLGAAGSGLDTPNQYDSAAYNWLAQQDTNTPEPQRPAFISWWDYGFQAIDQGQHPSVADNFQNGIDPAGQFLLSQNESLAISILATTLLQGEIQLHHSQTLSSSLTRLLKEDGLNVTTLHRLLTDEAGDYATVVAHPQTYLPVDPTTLSKDNAMYLASSYYLARTLPLAGVAKLYDDLQAYTGWSIRYAMADSRLFPFTGSNTGIFYAPADLTGRVINRAGVPTSFYNISILGSDGNVYPLGPLPAGVTAAQYNINYSTPFYRTMLYRTYIGYNGTDIGAGKGIPGLNGAVQADPVRPGWMLQHFQVVYRTAYACPGKPNANPSASCFHPTNLPDARLIANKTNGSADLSTRSYFQGGETMLAYYPGEPLLGTVRLPDGTPMPGVRATVYDGWGIPHMTAVTSSDGAFSLVLPPGNDTINFTAGLFNKTSQADGNVLSSVNLTVPASVGYALHAPNLIRNFQIREGRVDTLVYYNVANNTTFQPGVDPVLRGAKVVLTGLGGAPVLSGVTDASGTFTLTNAPSQTYNVTVSYAGRTYPQGFPVNVTPNHRSNLSIGLTPGAISGKVVNTAGTPEPGATVTISNSTGVVTTTTTSSTGSFYVRRLPPGSYQVYAALPLSSIRSAAVPVVVNTTVATTPLSLTMQPRGTVSVELTFQGVSAPSIPVRFVPIVGLVNGTETPIATLQHSTTSSTFAITGPTGFASVALAPGPYAVYAVGLIDGQRVATSGTVNVFSGRSIGPVPFLLSPAVPVDVTVAGEYGVSNASSTAVVAYASDGGEVIGWAPLNETAELLLPPGNYSFAAVHGTTVGGSATLMALGSATVRAPSTSLRLQLGTSVATDFSVGAPGPRGGFAGAQGARVVISAGPGGPAVQTVSGANGATGLQLPTLPPGSAGGYCVNVTTFGFAPNESCGWSAHDLASLHAYNLTIDPVAVTLQVVGLPSSTPVTVNITAGSTTAVDRTLTGGPDFSLSLPPGVYRIGARAVIGNGTVVYLPSSILSTTVPLGATYTNLTLVVIPEINASGRLLLPTGAGLASTTVNLTSSIFNVSVNGTQYTTAFRATPADYTATVTTTVGGTRYVAVAKVVIGSDGSISPKITVSQPGVAAKGSLVDPSGHALTLSLSASLVSSTGTTTAVPVTSGGFAATLPPGSYSFYGNGSVSVNGPNGSYLKSWSAAPGANCTFGVNASLCTVVMTGSVAPVAVRGHLTSGGLPTLLSGVVRLVGPYPSTNVTAVPATLGVFTADLAPGAYYAYAEATSTVNLAGFGRLLALPNAPSTSIGLRPTWTLSLHVSVASGANQTAGPANVTVQDLFGNRTVFAGVPIGTTINVPVPLGSYKLSATAPGKLNGIAGTATARATVRVSDGNVLVALPLSVAQEATVHAFVPGTATATVAAGGQVTFPLSVRASGNVPVTVHAIGSPSSWQFNFSFVNLTLQPGAPAFLGEVTLTVPNGTPVDHPPVAISFEQANGTSAGAVSPAPTVNVLAYYGVIADHLSTQTAQVGPTSARAFFQLKNTGNAFESVRLEVVDLDRLASSGWTVKLSAAGTPVPASGIVNLVAGANDSVTVNLTTNASVFLPPRSVTVQASVTNASGAVPSSTVTLSVPAATLTRDGGGTVTGPSVASGPSPIPEWFVPLVSFLPALALALGLVLRRWWKTRRWVRR